LPTIGYGWLVFAISSVLGDQALCAVGTSFAWWRIPWDGDEGALEEGIVDDVALVIFALDNPVAGKDFALTDVGEDEGGIFALACVYQKGSAGSERFQSSSPVGGCSSGKIYVITLPIKKA
jgi:hypothetical protein